MGFVSDYGEVCKKSEFYLIKKLIRINCILTAASQTERLFLSKLVPILVS